MPLGDSILTGNQPPDVGGVCFATTFSVVAGFAAGGGVAVGALEEGVASAVAGLGCASPAALGLASGDFLA